MKEKSFRNEKTRKKSEQIVLGLFTVFIAAMFVSSNLLGWHIIEREIILATLVANWVVYIKKYRDYTFRAEFFAGMSWINFILYALHAVSFTSMLATMSALIVMLGIFCIPRIIYLGVVASTFIILYHGFIAETITVKTPNDILRLSLHILSAYAVSFVTWIMIRNQQETSELLMENIKELEIAEQSKDDFMVNVSHEIRTPINAVCGMSEAILQEDLPIGVRRDIIDIQTAGRNLLSTVSNILDFSELESGKMELAEESYNITSTITDIINMALTLENGKRLELIVDCDADLPSNLVGDEQKLRRIILNLLDNAIKFTKEGGIVLRIKSRKEGYGINLMVSIKDSGIGMERTDMEKIFTSFSQVNSKRNREAGGVGLGLAITLALIRSMGGFITVDSIPGTGSEFQFTIPQKVLDETPIVSIKNKTDLFAACYINMEKYNYTVVREGYENCLRHVTEQLGIMLRNCKNLSELKRRMEKENYTHVFISWSEYCEDRNFFEQLAKEITVVLILDYEQETHKLSNMLRIYKPFTVLSIASVFNGQKVIQGEEQFTASEHHFIAPQVKVLVVDDNAMNLKVMARLLLPYQIKVTMASGGQEALDKLNDMEFDFVFLDHMMPEMDGVETLHKIRQKPGAYFQTLPIIAFTANAIGGAREMFLAEGFDDFIAKPIELSVLERILRRYIPVQKQIAVEGNITQSTADTIENAGTDALHTQKISENQGAVSAAKAGSFFPVASRDDSDAMEALSRAGIDIKQGISYCGDKEGFREIVIIYHTEGHKRKAALQRFLEEQDWKNYVITVHALKSNSKGIGANELAELAMNLELAGKENRIEYILENHEELMEKHDALLRTIADNPFIYPEGFHGTDTEEKEETEQNGETDDVPKEVEEHSLAEYVVLLKEKMDNFENDGLDEILDCLAKCRYNGISLATLADEIRDRINDFDFLGAAEILDSWEEKMEQAQ